MLIQIRYKYVKNDISTDYSGKTGLKLDPQYTISGLKLINQGVEMGGKGGVETPVLHSQKGISLQCGKFNSLIPYSFLNRFGKNHRKKICECARRSDREKHTSFFQLSRQISEEQPAGAHSVCFSAGTVFLLAGG